MSAMSSGVVKKKTGRKAKSTKSTPILNQAAMDVDRRITRSLASKVKQLELSKEDKQQKNHQVDQENPRSSINGAKKRKNVACKYHYEIDSWGRKKRVPGILNMDPNKRSKLDEAENILEPQDDDVQGDGDNSKELKGKSLKASSSRKRKASQSNQVLNNIKHEKSATCDSGKQSSINHHQAPSSHQQARSKVKSNTSNHVQANVASDVNGFLVNDCKKEVVPKSSSSTNHKNHNVPSYHPQVLNEATNFSKKPSSNKMIPVTITITSGSSVASGQRPNHAHCNQDNHNTIQHKSQQTHHVSPHHYQSATHARNYETNNYNSLQAANSPLANANLLSGNMLLDLPSSLSNRAMINTEVGTTGIATGSSPSVSSFDDEDIPEASVDFPKGILSTIKCNGCSKDFFTLDHVPKSDYYFHCFQCPEYCNKNETSRCYDCYSYFIDNESKERHYNLFHSIKQNKPMWMPPSQYTKSTLHRSNARIECRGCSEPFGCFVSPISQATVPSLEYYIHCIEDCSDYKRLQLIATCNTCGCKFMESKSLAGHKPHCSRILDKSLHGNSTLVQSCFPIMTSGSMSSVATANLMSTLHVTSAAMKSYQHQSAHR